MTALTRNERRFFAFLLALDVAAVLLALSTEPGGMLAVVSALIVRF